MVLDSLIEMNEEKKKTNSIGASKFGHFLQDLIGWPPKNLMIVFLTVFLSTLISKQKQLFVELVIKIL